MKQQESDKNRTDNAWKKLHKRLEEDALLHKEQPSGLMPWRAAVLWVVVALSALTVYLSFGEKQPLPAPVSQQTLSAPTRTAVLADSSIVYLDEGASLQYPDAFDADVREVDLKGNAMFDITGNPQHPFRIRIGTARVEVLGTTFYIRTDGDRFAELGVKSGRVKVTIPEIGYPVYIGQGEKATLRENQIQISSDVDDSFISSYTRRLYFKDETLGHVLHVLNRLNQESVRFEATPETVKRRITFTYSPMQAETLAELISTALGIRYRAESSTIIFIE